ncbi:MAG: hypothetical protein HY695_14825 [Deltaproteobacteria bacterium]|nr:hypothetical protein [Deltaproteobacteria bacterium]
MGRSGRKEPLREVSFDVPTIMREVDYIVGRTLEQDSRVVTFGPLVFFSTQTGDAWVLDPADSFGTCLARGGSRLPFRVKDQRDRVELQWGGAYFIERNSFNFVDHKSGRITTVDGYPVREIARAASRVTGAPKVDL